MTKDAAYWLDKMADEFEQHPERWTQGAMARGKKKRKLNACSPRAVCWCQSGWLIRFVTDNSYPYATDAMGNFSKFLFKMGAVSLNDSEGGREKIIRVARHAAAQLRAEK